jgi:aerobic C4-dicarboxylate transport protein
LTSKGGAGVTGSGFIVLAATLASVGTIPVASNALILGIDRYMSVPSNFTGNTILPFHDGAARWYNNKATVGERLAD